jgi:hypothetical protein
MYGIEMIAAWHNGHTKFCGSRANGSRNKMGATRGAYRQDGCIMSIFLSFQEGKQTKSGERKLKCV